MEVAPGVGVVRRGATCMHRESVPSYGFPAVTARRLDTARVNALVDTGAELSWIPRALLEVLGVERRKLWHSRQADGTVLERCTGAVHPYVAGTWTVDEVVFGEPGDLVLLGARSLDGVNPRVEPVSERLVDAGPAPAAVCAQ